jgi:hypothetical protein
MPDDGSISLVLGAQTVGNPLQDTVFDGAVRYVGVSLGTGVNAQELLLCILVASVSSAVHATNVSGGAVNATTASVAGTLTLGADADTCPDGSNAGSLRWDAVANTLELCDGSDWRTVSTNAPGSCAEIKQQSPGATSGSFTVAPGGNLAGRLLRHERNHRSTPPPVHHGKHKRPCTGQQPRWRLPLPAVVGHVQALHR